MEDQVMKDVSSEQPSSSSTGHPLTSSDEGEPSGKVMKKCNGVRLSMKSTDTDASSSSSTTTEDANENVAFLSPTLSSNVSNVSPDRVSNLSTSSESTRDFMISGLVDLGQNDSTRMPKPEEQKEELGSDDDITEDDSAKPTKQSKKDDFSEFDPTPKGPRPKHSWFLCREVINRQFGFANKMYDTFRSKCSNSLHMVQRLELMYKMSKHAGCVNALNFNTTGTKLVSGSDDLSIIIWDWMVEEPVLCYESGHGSNVFQSKFMPLSNDSVIVSCGRDGQVRLAEISATGVCRSTRKLAQHKGSAHKLSIPHFSPHSFLSCGEDAVVYDIDLRESKPKRVLMCKVNNNKVPLYTIQSNPNSPFEFAIGGRDQYARIYDKRFIGETPMKSFCPHHLLNSECKDNITCLVYNYNGSELLTSYNDEDIYLFNATHSDGADFIHKYQGHRNNQTVKGVNFYGSKSDYIISGSDCGYIYFWDKDTEHIVQSMLGDEGGVVNVLEPHPTYPFLATSGLDDDVKIWVPSCETDPDLNLIRPRISLNMKERDDEKKNERSEPDSIDGQMIWFLMQHLRRSARNRYRNRHQSTNEVNSLSSSSSSSSTEDSDEEREQSNSIQCTQS